MTDKEILQKVENGEGLTVPEIKRYQQLVKPQKQVYGKYGTLAKQYLSEHQTARYWVMIANNELVDYLHGVDRQADELYEVMYNKLSNSERFRRTGNFMEDYRRITEMQKVIETEILNEIVYV